MENKEAINQVAENLNLPKGFVAKVYKAYWKAIREYISKLPLKADLDDEQFLKLRPNVNIPSIGKLNVTLKKYKGIKRREEWRNEHLTKRRGTDKQVIKDKQKTN